MKLSVKVVTKLRGLSCTIFCEMPGNLYTKSDLMIMILQAL